MVKSAIRRVLRHPPKSKYEALRSADRYQQRKVRLLSKPISVLDAPSFAFMYNEIFEKEIYKFKTNNTEPIIIDGGANIGLSIIYFKTLFPSATVIGFEPDQQVYNTLEKNIQNFGLDNVTLIKKGLWEEETTLHFNSEGADAGRIHDFDGENIKKISIETCRLSNYLDRPIDFLKLDIEGAETEVLEESEDLLKNVANIFVEYHSLVNKPQSLYRILSILHEQDFRVHISNPGFVTEHPFLGLKNVSGMDMQLNIFGIK